MGIIESIIGAVIGWLVPKLLERISTEPVPTNKLSWLHWCFALGVGGAIGGFMSGTLAALGWRTPGGLGNWTAFGVSIGISQWWVLREYLNIRPSWAVLSALGWSVWAYFQATAAPAPLGWIMVGLAVGILQWFDLIKRVHWHILWVPANAFAWPIAGALGTAFGFALLNSGIPFPVAWVLGWGCVGLIGSLLLGLALVRMRKK
jgi:hypothetical protein